MEALVRVLRWNYYSARRITLPNLPVERLDARKNHGSCSTVAQFPK